MKTIQITFNKKTGGVTIETSGYEGAECLEATREIEKRLGLDDSDRQSKPEMFTVENQQQVGGA